MLPYLRNKGILLDRKLIKAAVILAVFLFAVYAGQRASLSLLMLVVAALGGIFLVNLLTRHIALGLLLVAPISFFVKAAAGTGTKVPLNATFLWVAFILGLWLIKMAVVERKIQVVSSRVTLPAVLFCLAIVISTIAGNLQLIPLAPAVASLSAQIGGGLLYGFSIAMLLFMGQAIQEMRWLKMAVWVFLGLGAIYFGGYIFSPLWKYTSDLFNAGAIGSMYWNWLVALAAGQLIGNRSLKGWVKALLAGLILVAFYRGWVLDKEWVSGWLPPLVALLVVISLRNWRYGLVLAILGGAFILFDFNSLDRAVMTPSQQYSVTSREWTWPILYQLVQYDPAFGLGPANYYHLTPLFTIDGFHVEFNSHNNYIDIIAQFGLVGLALFGWLVGEIALLGWRLRQRVQGGFETGYVYAALGGLAGMLVSGLMGDWFLPFLYNIGVDGFRASIFAWIFLGGLLSIEQLIKMNRVEHQ